MWKAIFSLIIIINKLITDEEEHKFLGTLSKACV